VHTICWDHNASVQHERDTRRWAPASCPSCPTPLRSGTRWWSKQWEASALAGVVHANNATHYRLKGDELPEETGFRPTMLWYFRHTSRYAAFPHAQTMMRVRCSLTHLASCVGRHALPSQPRACMRPTLGSPPRAVGSQQRRAWLAATPRAPAVGPCAWPQAQGAQRRRQQQCGPAARAACLGRKPDDAANG
jgi:hypothetical protein